MIKVSLRLILIGAIFIIGMSAHTNVFAQTINSSLMLYGQAGASFRFPNTYGPELNQLLKEGESYPQALSTYVVGVSKPISDKLFVGAEFLGIGYPKVSGNTTQTKTRSFGGTARLGYHLMTNKFGSWVPYLGLGMTQVLTTIRNNSVEEGGILVFNSPIFIAPGQSQKIHGQVGLVDVGTQLLGKTNGSISWGLAGGFQQRLVSSDWKSDTGDVVSFLSAPAHSMAYVRLMVYFLK